MSDERRSVRGAHAAHIAALQAPLTHRGPKTQRPKKDRERGTWSRRRARKAASTSRILHPDSVVCALSELLVPIARPVSNTLADVGIFAGRSLDELFPAPRRVPAVSVTGRWWLP